jgi:hypothetical protein
MVSKHGIRACVDRVAGPSAKLRWVSAKASLIQYPWKLRDAPCTVFHGGGAEETYIASFGAPQNSNTMQLPPVPPRNADADTT